MTSYFSQRLQSLVRRITLHLPMRMALGRLGIRLVRWGRFLQVRYANWNFEFRLRMEPGMGGSPGCSWCMFHVSEPVTAMNTVTFNGSGSQRSHQTALVRDLFAIKGVAQVVLAPYRIEIWRGRVFTWDEIRPDIERVILEHLTRKEASEAVV